MASRRVAAAALHFSVALSSSPLAKSPYASHATAQARLTLSTALRLTRTVSSSTTQPGFEWPSAGSPIRVVASTLRSPDGDVTLHPGRPLIGVIRSRLARGPG